METLFFYFGKVIICSGVMFLYYQLSLKDKTFHHYNRFYLLSAMLISILLPLIKVEDFTIEVNENLFLLINKIQNLNTNKTISHDYIYFRIIFSALGLVSLYFLGKFMYGIFRIQQLKSQFKKESFEGVNFYQTNLSEAPFSYFKHLFWKNSIIINSEVGKQILKHEMVHIEQKHSVDKIFIEIITSVFWFNPFFHIIKKEINLIHEYLADKKAVKQSDTKAFAQMLLASHFSGKTLPATSPFLSSNLKKRLKMLQKPQTKFGYARRIFALPVLFTVAFAYMVNAKNKEIKEVNSEIEKAVAEIKKDTISPKNEADKIVKIQQEKISKANEKLKIQSEKLKTLSEKSKEKAAELQKIAKEKGESSYEFELKAKELKQLSGEMDKIVDRDKQFRVDFDDLLSRRDKMLADKDAKVILKDMSFKRVFPDGDNYRISVNGEELDLEKMFDSKEFKENSGLSEEKIKALKDRFNSPEFKKKYSDINKFYFNGKDVFSDSEELKKIVKQYSGKDYTFFNDTNRISKKQLSKKDQRKLERLSKERAELARKQAEVARKQAEIVRQKAQNNPWIISVDAHAPKVNYSATSSYTESPIASNTKILSTGGTFKTNVKDMIKTNSVGDVKYFLDGKVSSSEEMQSLDPKNIESININKTKVSGKDTGEIHIKTKQK
ncbi:M56 family metallopeptidase [Chryseobacterium sp. 2TAF14]|uniref:M56 family metallopeptidase n=1 Tax=Chryseobacterium sp. 2TAF14 TaxID=3233007 RepID=UPI003F92AE58